jgi:peptidoglycan/LPS O-acetylase OafA/YrhL
MASETARRRLLWLDIAKGLSILWIVYFHFFRTYFEHGSLPPPDWHSVLSSALSFLGIAWLQISGLALHSVSVFIILSGWALMQSTARRAAKGELSWLAWYRARLLRLYPMYRVAHLVYLVSPFVARWEPVDQRIILSLLGLRFIDIDMNFFYLNASWWFFCMLIQFYLIFPLLFWMARQLGPWIYLLVACAIGFFARYLMLIVYGLNGDWVQGGFAVSRLPEFALGMALGMWHSRSTERAEWFFLRGPGFIAALVLYPAALQLYHNGFTYIFVDFACGACCLLLILRVAGFLSRFSKIAQGFALVGTFSYGIFLTHQPYVIWLGLRIRDQPIWLFLFIIVPVTLAVVSAWGIILEKATNALVQRLTGAKRRPSFA